VNWRKHRVQEGETLTEIARRYRTTTQAIAQVNSLKQGWTIQVGERLTIPVTPSRGGRGVVTADGSRIRYVVQRGDTVSSIARDFDVTMAQVRKWNKLRSSQLRAGRVLVIYSTDLAPPPSTVARTKQPVESADTPSEAKRVRVVHRVKKGDTLHAIAANYGTTIDSILDWNNLSRGDSLKVGDRLTIYVDR